MGSFKGLTKPLSAFFRKPAPETKGAALQGLSPNSRGSQAYDGQIRERCKDRQMDACNRKAPHAFIEDFVGTHQDGIRWKKGTSSPEYPTCHAQSPGK